MELLTRTCHARLSRRGSRNTVTLVCGSRFRLNSNNRHTDIVSVPEGRASRPNRRIPVIKLGHSNSVIGCDGRAGIAVFHLIEGIAVSDHIRLNGCGCGDPICWLGGLAAGWRRRGRPNLTHAHIVTKPETRTAGADFRVPGCELGERDAI